MSDAPTTTMFDDEGDEVTFTVLATSEGATHYIEYESPTDEGHAAYIGDWHPEMVAELQACGEIEWLAEPEMIDPREP